MRSVRGFTLVELVITMALSVIVVSFMASFVSGPVKGYTDQSRRAELVDLADGSLRMLARDIRTALPNSVRVRTVGTVVALEMLEAVDGGRYRWQPPGAADNMLDMSGADDRFDVVGGFPSVTKPFDSDAYYLSIYNVGTPGANAYEMANVISPPGTRITIGSSGVSNEDRVTLSPAFHFRYPSPGERVFLVSGPVTWLCDVAANTLDRYSGYSVVADQSLRDSAAELLAAGATAARASEGIAGCAFDITPGTAQRAGLVTARLAISDAGETVTLLHQVHTDNAP